MDFGGSNLAVTVLAIIDLAVEIYDSAKKFGGNFHGNFDLVLPLFQCLGAKNVPLANLYSNNCIRPCAWAVHVCGYAVQISRLHGYNHIF